MFIDIFQTSGTTTRNAAWERSSSHFSMTWGHWGKIGGIEDSAQNEFNTLKPDAILAVREVKRRCEIPNLVSVPGMSGRSKDRYLKRRCTRHIDQTSGWLQKSHCHQDRCFLGQIQNMKPHLGCQKEANLTACNIKELLRTDTIYSSMKYCIALLKCYAIMMGIRPEIHGLRCLVNGLKAICRNATHPVFLALTPFTFASVTCRLAWPETEVVRFVELSAAGSTVSKPSPETDKLLNDAAGTLQIAEKTFMGLLAAKVIPDFLHVRS